MEQQSWHEDLDTIKMIGRVLLGALVAGTLVNLSDLLHAAGIYDWVITASVMGLGALVFNTLRGTPFDGVTPMNARLSDRLSALRETVAESNGGRHFITPTAIRLESTALFGVVCATLELIVSAWVLDPMGLEVPLSGLISMSLVLAPIYVFLGFYRLRGGNSRSAFATKMIAGIERLTGWTEPDVDPRWRVLWSALTYVAVAVTSRYLAVQFLPQIFELEAAKWTAFFAIVLIVAGYELVRAWCLWFIAKTAAPSKKEISEDKE